MDFNDELFQPGCDAMRLISHMQPCGSRVTCNPPPTDTDCDVLILTGMTFKPDGEYMTSDECLTALDYWLHNHGWALGGSLPMNEDIAIPPEAEFHSWTKGDINLIVTASGVFYARFMAATRLATKYNLLDKEDRIQLFQAVLYGEQYGFD